MLVRNKASTRECSGIGGYMPSIVSQWQKTWVSTCAFGNGTSVTLLNSTSCIKVEFDLSM